MVIYDYNHCDYNWPLVSGPVTGLQLFGRLADGRRKI